LLPDSEQKIFEKAVGICPTAVIKIKKI
jgi:ferredoxin